VIRVAPADRRVERVLGVADLGPTVKDFGFDGRPPMARCFWEPVGGAATSMPWSGEFPETFTTWTEADQ
jgi:hypothetical protein